MAVYLYVTLYDCVVNRYARIMSRLQCRKELTILSEIFYTKHSVVSRRGDDNAMLFARE